MIYKIYYYLDNEENITAFWNKASEYEGVIPMLKRWFSGSGTTDGMREWVEKYMDLETCPSCNGARLKKESLWFKIYDKNIAELSN